jgi:hypothetical protein
LEDLFVNNYRSQGLAEKIFKTHQIVLANRSKDRVRSEKGFGMDLFVKIYTFQGVFYEIRKTQKLI